MIFSPLQILARTGAIEAVRFGFTVTVLDVVAVQEFPSVTVTL